MKSHELIAQMRKLIEEYDRSAYPEPKAERVVTMVGLSQGEHEEICDANYTRQKIQFSRRSDGMWRNENPVYFGTAAGTYGADSIILDGGDFKQKVMCRMAAPIMCVAGVSGAGFAPNALSVSPDVMERATGRPMAEFERFMHEAPNRQAALSEEFERFLSQEPRESYAPAPVKWEPGTLRDKLAPFEMPQSGSRSALYYEHALRENASMQKHIKEHQSLLAEQIESFKKDGFAGPLLRTVDREVFDRALQGYKAQQRALDALRDREQARQLLTTGEVDRMEPYRPVTSQKTIDAYNEAAGELYKQISGVSSVARGIYMPKDAVDALPDRDERTKDFDDLEELNKRGLLSASGLNPVEPQDGPGYCGACERISLPRRNQLVSMGHTVSHLVELPNEQGYALPCKSCRA